MLPSVTAIPVETVQAPSIPQQSQNLFEYMATRSTGLSDAANPAQLAQKALEGMQGFMDRAAFYARKEKSYGEDVMNFTGGFASPSQERGKENPMVDTERPAFSDERINKVIDSMAKSFNYSTEVTIVARGAFAISSSVNTLLRGQ